MKPFAQKVLAHKDSILDAWCKKVRQVIPGAKDKSGPALLNSIPVILENIAHRIDGTPLSIKKEKEEQIARNHAEERLHYEGYSLEQVIEEYRILTNVLMEQIDPENKMSIQDGKLIWEATNDFIKYSADNFAKMREEEKQKLSSNLIKEKENHYKSIIDGVQDYAIFTLDEKGFITFWNSGAVRMEGYKEAEVIGKHFSMFYPHEAIIRHEPMDHLKVARLEGRFRGEGLRVKKNGELFMADVYIIPLKKDDKLVGFAKIVEDLSEHNKLIQERDLSITEAINLKIENELRDTFVAVLSHDLRGPLTAVKMSAQLILRNPIDHAKHLHLATKIVENVNRADKMVMNYLDANKIKAGEQLKLEKGECNLMKIANDVVDDLSVSHGTQVKIYGPDQIRGNFDCEGMRRVFENLLSNALKYGDLSRPITLSVESIDDRVHVKVHNFGNVIELPDQLLLFEKFHRAKAAEKGEKIGWGLGLTLVKGIVEAHNGIVKVESLPKEGTTFFVDLPNDLAEKKPNVDMSPYNSREGEAQKD